MIERIFHPIGQGAFYSERHENFNIVYDCGNWKNTKLADRVVRQAFSKDEVVDILFISHFDYDHVNKIKILRKHTKIKKVVMPLLHDNEKSLLINLYRALNFNILTLIENPQEFFGEETQIITVESQNTLVEYRGESQNNDNIFSTTDLDHFDNVSIPSGAIIVKKFSAYEWVYIPHNIDYADRNQELENMLSVIGFDLDRLKSDAKYTINETVSNRKKLKEVYAKISGNINQNSMLLYSGLNHLCKNCEREVFAISKHKDLHQLLHRKTMTRERHKVSCIYTGDADLNTVNIKSIFQDLWENVGTIQVPHHGDIKSFDFCILDDGYYLCPISVGEKNKYGHPSSKLISKIISRGSSPVLITEDLSSGLMEHITY